MKYLKFFGWGLFLLFLQSSILGIPFADMQTCELPNGDKVKIRTTENWYLLKGLNPHGSAWGDRATKAWYVPHGWFERKIQNIGGDGNCSQYGLFANVVNLGAKYKLSNKNKFVYFYDGESDGYFENNAIISQLSAQVDDSLLLPDKFGNKWPKLKPEILAVGLDSGMVSFYGLINRKLYHEVALVNPSDFMPKYRLKGRECQQYIKESCQIVAVFQSNSTDAGKTWSKPIVTKDARIFVLGKTLLQQPGIAKSGSSLKYIGWL